jgi:DNA-directed RNA polymerase subunit alpha
MTEAAAAPKLDELLAGPVGRDNFEQITQAVYESYANVDLAHGYVKQALEEIAGDSAEVDRELIEKLGILLFIMGEYDQAFKQLYEVRNRKNAAHFLGRTYLKLDLPQEALRYLENSSHGEEDYATGVLMVEAHRMLRQAEEARKLADKLPADSADGLYARALAADTAGEYAEAIEFYEKALELDPEHAGALFCLALNCDLNGEDDRAIELFRRCADLKTSSVGPLLNLGILYEDRGDYYQAIDCYKRVLAIAPRHPMARLYLKDAESGLNMYMDTRRARHMRRIEEVLRLPVSSFELSPRSRACLDRMDVKTLGGLSKISRDQLLGEKNFGDTSLTEIEALLARFDLALRHSLDEPFPEETDEEEPEDTDEVTIEELNLSTRCRKCMDRLGVRTVSELVRHTEKDLLAVPNFGGTSLAEIRSKLAELGLTLKSE